MELKDWKLSKQHKVIHGRVRYELSGRLVEGEKYKGEVLSYLYQHGHVLIRTYQYNIICWVMETDDGSKT